MVLLIVNYGSVRLLTVTKIFNDYSPSFNVNLILL